MSDLFGLYYRCTSVFVCRSRATFLFDRFLRTTVVSVLWDRFVRRFYTTISYNRFVCRATVLCSCVIRPFRKTVLWDLFCTTDLCEHFVRLFGANISYYCFVRTFRTTALCNHLERLSIVCARPRVWYVLLIQLDIEGVTYTIEWGHS